MTDEEIPAPAAPAAREAEGFGAAIARAREERGYTQAALGARLRLSGRQIDALEKGNLAALPSRTYVRGFVRNCARELGLDPQPLLDDLERRLGAVEPSAPPQEAPPFRFTALTESAKPLVLLLLGLLAIAGVTGLLLPRHASTPAAAARSTAVPSAGSAASGEPGATPSAVTTPPSFPSSPANAGGNPQPSARPASAVASSAVGPTGNPPGNPAAGTVASAPANAIVNAAGNPSSLVAARPPVAAASAAPVTPPPVGRVAGTQEPRLELSFAQDAWVQVEQADGIVLISQLCPAGSTQNLGGKLPLRVVIGNAGNVQARFRGAPVDLLAAAGTTGVARLVLQ